MWVHDYDDIKARARKIKTCPKRHDCHRYDHIMGEWYTGRPGDASEVWDMDKQTPEVVHGGSWAGCQGFVAGSKLVNLHIVENGRCLVCDMYDNRKAYREKGRNLPFIIVAYGISQHYGGDEDGGWWYDITEILEVRDALTFEEGRQQARELKEEYPKPRYPRTSCANNGEADIYIKCFYSGLDPRMPKNSPQGKPIYE